MVIIYIDSNGVLSSTNTTYAIGDGGLTQNNFTDTLKTKLDNIDTNANNYSLPTASSSVLGGIKVGTGLTIDNTGALNTRSTLALDTISENTINNGVVIGNDLCVSNDLYFSNTRSGSRITKSPDGKTKFMFHPDNKHFIEQVYTGSSNPFNLPFTDGLHLRDILL